MNIDWKKILVEHLQVATLLEALLWKAPARRVLQPSDRNNLICALADRTFRNFKAVHVLTKLMLADQAFAMHRMALESGTNCIFLAVTDREDDVEDFMDYPGFDIGRHIDRLQRENPRVLPPERKKEMDEILSHFRRTKSRYRKYGNDWCRLSLRERSTFNANFFGLAELQDFVDGHHAETSAFIHSGPASILGSLRADEKGNIEISGARSYIDCVHVISVSLNFMFSFAGQLFMKVAPDLLPECKELKDIWRPVNLSGNPL